MNKASLILAASLAGLVTACGQQDTAAPEGAALEPPATAAPATADETPVPATSANTAGASVYNSACAFCHAAGVAGAPKPGDKAEWVPRTAQGQEVLYKHAIEGYTGEKGMMPARGGAANLTDDEVKAAVDYMVDKSS
ncbi:MAG: c-type cytochrome [Gammaproteobacteria bacterium]